MKKFSTTFTQTEHCCSCPRNCHGIRTTTTAKGFCHAPSAIRLARAALHFWEEPIISGTCGSGAVFFSGCNMHCIYCQNKTIAEGDGRSISPQRLYDIFFELQEKKAANINLVTPSHYVPVLAPILRKAKQDGLTIPIVYNTSGYDSPRQLALLEGLIDIYLPDCKYFSSDLSNRYSSCSDYFTVCLQALRIMFQQVGPFHLSNNGLLQRGMIIRHLVLPGCYKDSITLLDLLYQEFGDQVYFSLMSQYTPIQPLPNYPELNRRVTTYEYQKVIRHAQDIGITLAFTQNRSTASESFIPEFNYEGVEPLT